MTIDIPREKYYQWKQAYNACKKQSSVAIKDLYDTYFLGYIRDEYTKTFKEVIDNKTTKKSEISLNDFQTFLNNVITRSNKYLQDETKWSPFYKKKRQQAVNYLIVASQNLNNYINDALKKEKMDPLLSSEVSDIIEGMKVSETKISIQRKMKCLAYVLDVPWLPYTESTTLRLYIILKGEGKLLSKLNYEVDLANYEFSDGTKYTDKNFKSRKFYKIASNSVQTPLYKNNFCNLVGKLSVDVYLSPNDIGSKLLKKCVSFDSEQVLKYTDL